MANVTHEQGHRGPAQVTRLYNSTYIHIPTGKTYIQTTFPQGNNWIEDAPGDRPTVDGVTIIYNAQGQLEAVPSGGGETLAETLALGNLSGTNDIRMQSTNVVNDNATTDMGLIFSEDNTWFYAATDGLWSGTGGAKNAGLFADQSGYATIFADDWNTSLEMAADYLGGYVGSSEFQFWIAGSKGNDSYFYVSNKGQDVIAAGDTIAANYVTSFLPLGIVNLVSQGSTAYQNTTAGIDPHQRNVGNAFISTNNAAFGYNAQFGTVPEHSTIIASQGCTIKGRNTILVADYMQYGSITSSWTSSITSSLYTSIIASRDVDVTDMENVAVIGYQSALVLTDADIRDGSTVMENSYTEGKAFFKSINGDLTEAFANVPMLGATPTGGTVNGDMWFVDDVGGLKLFVKDGSGVVKSVTLT